MRFWLLRTLFVLISANVAYGTQGDIYADKVQMLINPLEAHISYSPDVNTDLYVAHKNKESDRADRLIKSFKRHTQTLAGYLVFRLSPNKTVVASLDDPVAVHHRVVRQLIFPHHSFS